MKSFLKNFERVFVYYFSSMGISLLISILFSIPLKFMIKNYNSLTNFMVGIIGVIVVMFILFYKDGYDSGKFDIKLLSASLAVLLVLLVGVIAVIGHTVYISGPTDYLARHIVYSLRLSNGKVWLNRYSIGLMAAAFIILYTPIILTAEYLGFKKRKG